MLDCPLLDFLFDEDVELLPSYVLLSLSGDVLDRFLDVVLSQVQLQHSGDLLEIIESYSFLALLMN